MFVEGLALLLLVQ